MQRAQAEANDLQKSVDTLDKDTMALKNARGYLKDVRSKIKELKDNRDRLDKDFATVTKDKLQMTQKFESVISDLRKKSDYKNHILD